MDLQHHSEDNDCETDDETVDYFKNLSIEDLKEAVKFE